MWPALRCVLMSMAQCLALSGKGGASSFQLFSFLGKDTDRPRIVTRCPSSDFEGLRVTPSVGKNKVKTSRGALARSEGPIVPKSPKKKMSGIPNILRIGSVKSREKRLYCMTAEMAPNIKVRLKKTYHLSSVGNHSAMTASLECCSLMGNCSYAASWSALKKLQPLRNWLRRREISTRRPRDASFIG